MTKWVAVPVDTLYDISDEAAVEEAIGTLDVIEEARNRSVPVAGPVCPTCGRTHCNEYSAGSRCSSPRCDGELIDIGERVGPYDD